MLCRVSCTNGMVYSCFITVFKMDRGYYYEFWSRLTNSSSYLVDIRKSSHDTIHRITGISSFITINDNQFIPPDDTLSTRNQLQENIYPQECQTIMGDNICQLLFYVVLHQYTHTLWKQRDTIWKQSDRIPPNLLNHDIII